MVKKQASGSELQLLKTHIREKNPERLYIFFGEETFLLEHYLGSLKKLVLDALTESFNYHRFNTETFDLTAFSEAVENLPMMAAMVGSTFLSRTTIFRSTRSMLLVSYITPR